MELTIFFVCIQILQLILLRPIFTINNATYRKLILHHPNQDAWKETEVIIRNYFDGRLVFPIVIADWDAEDQDIVTTIFSSISPLHLFKANDTIFEINKSNLFEELSKTDIEYSKLYPASSVTIIISNEIPLILLLQNLKDSIWWNSQAYFLLINKDMGKCYLANTFLKMVWEFNVLMALYVCIDDKKEIVLYNFNPYGPLGSNFWKVVQDEYDKNSRWTLLEHSFNNALQKYGSESSINNGFIFDKSKHLNKHVVRVGFCKEGSNSHIPIFQDILKHLNGQMQIKYYSYFGVITEKGPQGFLKDIQLSKLDFILHELLLRSYWRLQTYPYTESGLCIITQNNPIRFIYRLLSTPKAGFLLVCISVILVLILSRIFKLSIVLTIIEFLRISTNAPSIKEPQNYFKKLAFCQILITILLINAYVQSLLNTLEIVPELSLKIDSIVDLIDSKIPIWAEKQHEEFIVNAGLQKNYLPVKNVSNCFKTLLKGGNVACVYSCKFCFDKNQNARGMHESIFNLINRPTAFVVSQNNPLKNEIELQYNKILQAGLYKRYQENINSFKKNYATVTQQTLYIKNVDYYFTKFLEGCGLSFIVLLIEFFSNKINSYFLWKP